MTIPVTELGNRLAGELWRSGLPRPKAFEVGKVFEDLQRDRDDLVELCRLLGPSFAHYESCWSNVLDCMTTERWQVASDQDYEGLGARDVDEDTYRRLEALWRRLGEPTDG